MKKKRKRAIIVAVIAVVVCAVLVIGLVAPIGLNAPKKGTTADSSVTAEETDGSINETPENVSGEAEGSVAPESENSNGSGFFGSIGSIFGNLTSGSDSKKISGHPAKPPKSVSGQTLPEITFPYTVEGSDIVVEQISPYNGYFIEDGQDEDISNVAAIVLTNKGDDADFVGIGISQGDRSLAFSASQIPAGASVIVLEQNKASYAGDDPYYSCTANVTRTDDFNLNEDRIEIKEDDNGGFQVSNISDESIPQVKILFKNYIPDEDIYVGGITYTVTLSDLEPGMGTSVALSHYDPQYSKFIEAVIEE